MRACYKNFFYILYYIILFFYCLMCIGTVYATPQDVYPFVSLQEAKRFEVLIKEIRCVVCQGQNIADSNAPLAADMREKIYKMMIDKKSNVEIKNYLAQRYGEFILLQPRWNKTTWWLWLFPLVGVGVGIGIIVIAKKNRAL